MALRLLFLAAGQAVLGKVAILGCWWFLAFRAFEGIEVYGSFLCFGGFNLRVL